MLGCCQEQFVVEGEENVHSWASDTSPVMAEKPRNGTLGRTRFSTRKQSIQSSPGFDSSMDSTLWERSVHTCFVLNFDLLITFIKKRKSLHSGIYSHRGNYLWYMSALIWLRRSYGGNWPMIARSSRMKKGIGKSTLTEQAPIAWSSPSLP